MGKSQNALGNGPLCDQKGVKSGSQTRFPKYDLGPFAMLQEVVLGPLGPRSAIVWPMARPKLPGKWVVLGPKGVKKWVQNICFQK